MFTGNDLIFNGYNFSQDLYVEEVIRQVLGQISHQSLSIPGRAGLLHRSAKIGAKEILVKVRIIANTRTEVMRKAHEIAAKLYTEKPAELITRGDDLRDLAVLSGDTILDQLFETGYAELRFVNFSGLQHGDAVTVQLPNGQPFAVQGTYKTRGIFTVQIVNQTSGLTLSSQTTGKMVKLTGTFSPGSVIVVDCEKESVRMGGNLIMTQVDHAATRFFDLLPGENIISRSAGACSLSYVPRFL